MASQLLKTLLLPELLKGMSVTWRMFLSPKYNAQLSGREDAAIAALPRTACPASLCERRGALHCLQTV